MTITEWRERTDAILTAVGALSMVGGICTSAGVKYPVSESPALWIATVALWTIAAGCAAACLTSDARRKKSRNKKCHGIMRMDTDGRWYTER